MIAKPYTGRTQGVIAALNDAVVLPVDAFGTAAIDVRGTFSGTLLVQGRSDTANWVTLSVGVKASAVNSAIALSITAPGLYHVDVSGLNELRVTASPWSSGSATVTLDAEPGNAWVQAVMIGSPAVTLNTGTASTGAASAAHLVSAATTNPTVIKASAGRLLGWAIANTSAAWRYVKLHNQATAPTAGSGVVRTIAVPPGGLAQLHLTAGVAFTAGIAMTTVTGSADADATAVGAGDLVGEVFFG